MDSIACLPALSVATAHATSWKSLGRLRLLCLGICIFGCTCCDSCDMKCYWVVSSSRLADTDWGGLNLDFTWISMAPMAFSSPEASFRCALISSLQPPYATGSHTTTHTLHSKCIKTRDVPRTYCNSRCWDLWDKGDIVPVCLQSQCRGLNHPQTCCLPTSFFHLFRKWKMACEWEVWLGEAPDTIPRAPSSLSPKEKENKMF